VPPPDRTAIAAHVERIDRLIEEYRAAMRRRLLQRALKFWRRTEAERPLAASGLPPERFH
jgi:hypothetical protein